MSSALDPAPKAFTVEALLVSFGSVALAEIGDKTQLLALVLAARFRKPLPILAGILVATLANHAVAAGLGTWVASLLTLETLRWLVAASFIAMGLWILIPDTDDGAGNRYRHGAFLTTLIAFFLVEIGDKTQLATALLASRYGEVSTVVLGSTLGMLMANAPVIVLGQISSRKLPLRLIRIAAAVLFVALGGIAALGGSLS